MNKVKLNNLIKEGNIVIPLYIFKLYKKFNLTLDEFVILMYLYNKNGLVFDPEKIQNDLGLDIMEVMGYVSVLTDKGLINIDVIKDEKGFFEERINLNNFYEKISLSLMNEFNEIEEKNNDNIYAIIEREFNRKLSPMECEVIKEWQDNNYSDELIKEALKEASLNGVSNLRYIDKILFEWDRQGIKTVSDIKKNKDAKEKEIVEIYNCNWLDDEDE